MWKYKLWIWSLWQLWVSSPGQQVNLSSLKHVNKLRFKSWKSIGQFLLTEYKLWFLWSHFQHLENRKVPVSGQSVLRGPFLEILENASNIRTNRMILLRCRTCAKEKWAAELNEQLGISLWRISRSSSGFGVMIRSVWWSLSRSMTKKATLKDNWFDIEWKTTTALTTQYI